MQLPQNEAEWKEVEQTYQKWNFPHCVGAMDGKHINLQAPIGSGTEYFNYKGFHSIVLFAVVDGNYNFIYANVGAQGRISDGGIFAATSFKESLDKMTMNLPTPCSLPGRTKATPYVFLGDDAFPLAENIMKPIGGTHEENSKERIFNYRVSRARRVVENVFGISSSVFRVLRKPMLLEPSVARQVVLAIIHLHNFLRQSSSRKIYNPPGTFEKECPDTGDVTGGIWKQDEPNTRGLTSFPNIPRRSSMDAQKVRREFMEYFISPQGEVSFQYGR